MALAWLPDIGWRRTWPLAGAGLGSAVAVVVGGDSGTFPSDIYSAGGVAAFTVLGALFLPRELVVIRRFVLIYGAAAAVLLAVPNPVGGNVDRLGRLIAIPLAVWVLGREAQGRDRRSSLRGSTLGVSLLAAMLWHFYPVVSAIARSSDDPSNAASYYSGLLGFLATQDPTQGRLEIPFTREHWEAAFVAPHFPIARGWERQLDLEYNDVLYHPLTPASLPHLVRCGGGRPGRGTDSADRLRRRGRTCAARTAAGLPQARLPGRELAGVPGGASHFDRFGQRREVDQHRLGVLHPSVPSSRYGHCPVARKCAVADQLTDCLPRIGPGRLAAYPRHSSRDHQGGRLDHGQWPASPRCALLRRKLIRLLP